MDRWNDWDDGKSTWLTSALMLVVSVVVLLLCGCRTYTVVAADREVVPVRQSNAIEGEVTRRTYVEAVEDATGWYVPDAVMLELLGAE